MPSPARRIALVIIDGFGVSNGGACDAIAAASMPNWRALCAQHPHTTLGASGEITVFGSRLLGMAGDARLKARTSL